MGNRASTVERAFQLAKSGDFADLSAVQSQLSTEAYRDWRHQTDGPLIKKQLRQLIADNYREPDVPGQE